MRNSLLLLSTVVIVACNDAGVDINDEHSGDMFFETEFVNFAWFYTYRGTVIDKVGNLCSYDPGQDHAPVLVHADGYYTEDELRSKYAHARTFQHRIPEDTLRRISTLALGVTAGTFTDTRHVMADAGRLECSVYIYRPAVHRFQKLTLKVTGDYEFYNTSESAITLAAWMLQGLIIEP